MGYCDPPKHSQFQPGKSGNKSGRPPHAKGRKQILERIAYELCEVRVAGKIERLPRIEVLLMAVRNATANGSPSAQQLYDRLLNEVTENHEEPPAPKGVFITGEKLTAEEWMVEYGHVNGRNPKPPCRKRGIKLD